MSTTPELSWVGSLGGPLIVVPVSALQQWGASTDDPDDYDRACAVEGWAGIIPVGAQASGLVLADEPALTCYLPERSVFVRWLAADSETELLNAAEAVLNDPATQWEDCGVWVSDGPAVLMGSAEAGADLGTMYPDGRGSPEQAAVPLVAGRWKVRAFHQTNDFPWVGVVQLLPLQSTVADQAQRWAENGYSQYEILEIPVRT